jgi:hypothetical protein
MKGGAGGKQQERTVSRPRDTVPTNLETVMSGARIVEAGFDGGGRRFGLL